MQSCLVTISVLAGLLTIFGIKGLFQWKTVRDASLRITTATKRLLLAFEMIARDAVHEIGISRRLDEAWLNRATDTLSQAFQDIDEHDKATLLYALLSSLCIITAYMIGLLVFMIAFDITIRSPPAKLGHLLIGPLLFFASPMAICVVIVPIVARKVIDFLERLLTP